MNTTVNFKFGSPVQPTLAQAIVLAATQAEAFRLDVFNRFVTAGFTPTVTRDDLVGLVSVETDHIRLLNEVDKSVSIRLTIAIPHSEILDDDALTAINGVVNDAAGDFIAATGFVAEPTADVGPTPYLQNLPATIQVDND